MNQASRIVVVTGFLLLSMLSAQAQWSYGLEAGFSVTNLSKKGDNPKSSNYSNGFGIPFGATTSWAFGQGLSLQSGLDYSPIHAATSDRHPFPNLTTAEPLYTDCMSELRLHYLSVPLQLQYQLQLGKEWSLIGQAGPSFQLLLYAEQTDEGFGDVYSVDGSTISTQQYFHIRRNVTPMYHSWNWSLEGALGVKWQVGNDYGIVKVGGVQGINQIERESDNGSHVVEAFTFMISYGTIIHCKAGKKH